MKTIKSFNESQKAYSITPGDICTFNTVRYQPDLIILRSVYGRKGQTVTVVRVNDKSKAVAGDKGVIATVKNIGPYDVKFTGKKVTSAELKKMLATDDAVYQEKQEKFKERDKKIDWDRNDGHRVVVMQDKNTAKDGDEVIIEFDNGKFKGSIKRIDNDGWVMWVAPRRKVARKINPSKVMRKVAAGDSFDPYGRLRMKY